jgi:hypothetical protein
MVEQGDIQFLTQPSRAHRESPGEEIDRFFMVLSPGGGRHRLIELGRKRTPEMEQLRASSAHHTWGTVELLADDLSVIREALLRRPQDGARVIGTGKYLIKNHGNHGDLAYALDIPESGREDARHMAVKEDDLLVWSVQNPDSPVPDGFAPRQNRPDYPDELAGRFDGQRFLDSGDPRFLDYQDTAVVFMDPNPRLVHAELKVLIDEEAEAAERQEAVGSLKRQLKDDPTEPLIR